MCALLSMNPNRIVSLPLKRKCCTITKPGILCFNLKIKRYVVIGPPFCHIDIIDTGIHHVETRENSTTNKKRGDINTKRIISVNAGWVIMIYLERSNKDVSVKKGNVAHLYCMHPTCLSTVKWGMTNLSSNLWTLRTVVKYNNSMADAINTNLTVESRPSSATAVKSFQMQWIWLSLFSIVCPKEMPVECCQNKMIEASALALRGQ